VQAGAFAGFSINLIVYPLDTIKTRLQSPLFHQIYRSSSGIANRALFRGLYQGVGTVILVTVPSSGAFFTTYEGLKYALGSSVIPQPAVYAVSSSVAQLVNCAIVTPAEVIKQNAQVLAHDHRKKREGSPTMQVMRQLKKHPAKLWRGYTALVARDLPFTALQFPGFEYLKKILIARRSRLKGGEPVNGVFERAKISAISAGIAGSAAAWVTTPVDVIKTRMMLEAGQNNQNEHPGKGLMDGQNRDAAPRNPFQIGKDVFVKEGVRGMFRGGLIRGVWTIFGNGAYMGCYEGAKFYLEDRGKTGDEDKLGPVRRPHDI
jgi:hypothetical protein